VRHGEIWWAGIDERRLVLVLSTSDDEVRGVVIVSAAESLIDGLMEEVRLGAEEGLPGVGVVRVAFPSEGFVPCNWMITLPLSEMVERAGELSADKLAEVNSLLRRAGLGIDLA
jgi:mRNA interferase MazF